MRLTIVGAPGLPPKFAVPDFLAGGGDSATGKLVGQVLWDDLNFEREFYLVPRDTYAHAFRQPASLDQVPLDRWKELGVDGLVVGSVRTKRQQHRRPGPADRGQRAAESVFAKEYSGGGDEPAVLRPHHRRRDSPAAAGAARRGADQAGVHVRSRWRAGERRGQRRAISRTSILPITTARTSGGSRPRRRSISRPPGHRTRTRSRTRRIGRASPTSSWLRPDRPRALAKPGERVTGEAQLSSGLVA